MIYHLGVTGRNQRLGQAPSGSNRGEFMGCPISIPALVIRSRVSPTHRFFSPAARKVGHLACFRMFEVIVPTLFVLLSTHFLPNRTWRASILCVYL